MKKLILLGISAFLLISCNCNDESENNVAIIDNLYASFAKGDIDSFVAVLDEKVEWNEAENFPYDDGNPYIGSQAILDGVLGRIGNDWNDWSVVEVETYGMNDNMVLGTGRYTATHKLTNKKINAQVAHLFTLKNGKIVKFQQYVDTKQVYDATLE